MVQASTPDGRADELHFAAQRLHPHLGRGEWPGANDGNHSGQAPEIAFVPTLMSRSYPFVLDCILGGLGVGLVPDHTTRARMQTGELVPVLAEYQFGIDRNHMYLMYMPNRHQSRATITFIDFLTDKMGRLRIVRWSDG